MYIKMLFTEKEPQLFRRKEILKRWATIIKETKVIMLRNFITIGKVLILKINDENKKEPKLSYCVNGNVNCYKYLSEYCGVKQHNWIYTFTFIQMPSKYISLYKDKQTLCYQH